jgi:hypothetical protein
MPTRPDSPDPTGTAGASANPFAQLGSDMGKGMDFFQDWMKAAGSALPHVSGASTTPGAMPGWSLPTLDPAELDKRIQELKTVQFWLEQNARMVAMSIQGLEVQRMTLSTLQGMNVSMDQLKDSLKVKPEAFRDFFRPHSPAPEAAAAPASPAPSAPAPAPAAESAPAPADLSRRSSWFQGAPSAAEAAPGDGGSDDAPAGDAEPGAEGAQATESGEASPAADLINPLRWWDTLTQQFSHLASQAVAPSTAPKAHASAHPLTSTNKPARAAKPTGSAKSPAPSGARKTASKTASKTAGQKAAPRAGTAPPSPAPRSKPKARS